MLLIPKTYIFIVTIHYFWQPPLKFTAQMIIKDLRNNHSQVLPHFFVWAKDRKYQIGERKNLNIELYSNVIMY
jgi:hypothetical protein